MLSMLWHDIGVLTLFSIFYRPRSMLRYLSYNHKCAHKQDLQKYMRKGSYAHVAYFALRHQPFLHFDLPYQFNHVNFMLNQQL